MATAATSASVQERPRAVTFKGTPVTLIGPQIKAGAAAPEFQVLAQDLAPVSLSSAKGKTLLISVTPSLDTPVCDLQAKRLNQEASTLQSVEIWNISMDLPFAQKRWCGATGSHAIKVLSDHKDASFGRAFGVLIKELRLLARAIFLVDGSGTVRYAEYVPDVASHPNYDAALAAARQAAA